MSTTKKIKRKAKTNAPLISFDYAIKYLLKHKGDYSIVESFISALLKTKGYDEVKIIGLLDPESNKERAEIKQSIADVVVEDRKHRKYIIEIERNVTDGSFIHKAFFNISRLVSDNLKKAAKYKNVVKVFHISLLYFPVGNDTIYHGRVIMTGIKTNEELTVRSKTSKTAVRSNATEGLPEYFVISIPRFNDHFEKEIDEWLYVMKHGEVLDTFQSPSMKEVAEKLSILRMTKSEHDEYLYHQKKLQETKDIDDRIENAKAEGIEEGEIKKSKKIALKMLKKNMNVELIAELSELSLEQIELLKS